MPPNASSAATVNAAAVHVQFLRVLAALIGSPRAAFREIPLQCGLDGAHGTVPAELSLIVEVHGALDHQRDRADDVGRELGRPHAVQLVNFHGLPRPGRDLDVDLLHGTVRLQELDAGRGALFAGVLEENVGIEALRRETFCQVPLGRRRRDRRGVGALGYPEVVEVDRALDHHRHARLHLHGQVRRFEPLYLVHVDGLAAVGSDLLDGADHLALGEHVIDLHGGVLAVRVLDEHVSVEAFAGISLREVPVPRRRGHAGRVMPARFAVVVLEVHRPLDDDRRFGGDLDGEVGLLAAGHVGAVEREARMRLQCAGVVDVLAVRAHETDVHRVLHLGGVLDAHVGPETPVGRALSEVPLARGHSDAWSVVASPALFEVEVHRALRDDGHTVGAGDHGGEVHVGLRVVHVDGVPGHGLDGHVLDVLAAAGVHVADLHLGSLGRVRVHHKKVLIEPPGVPEVVVDAGGDPRGDLLPELRVLQHLRLGGVGEEGALDERRCHVGVLEHVEPGLFHAPVGELDPTDHFLMDECGQAPPVLRVVVGVGLGPFRLDRVSVVVDRQEDGGVRVVGDVAALLERKGLVAGARHEDLVTLGLDERPRAQGYVQVDVFLLDPVIVDARVIPAVPRVEADEGEAPSCLRARRGRRDRARESRDQYGDQRCCCCYSAVHPAPIRGPNNKPGAPGVHAPAPWQKDRIQLGNDYIMLLLLSSAPSVLALRVASRFRHSVTADPDGVGPAAPVVEVYGPLDDDRTVRRHPGAGFRAWESLVHRYREAAARRYGIAPGGVHPVRLHERHRYFPDLVARVLNQHPRLEALVRVAFGKEPGAVGRRGADAVVAVAAIVPVHGALDQDGALCAYFDRHLARGQVVVHPDSEPALWRQQELLDGVRAGGLHEGHGDVVVGRGRVLDQHVLLEALVRVTFGEVPRLRWRARPYRIRAGGHVVEVLGPLHDHGGRAVDLGRYRLGRDDVIDVDGEPGVRTHLVLLCRRARARRHELGGDVGVGRPGVLDEDVLVEVVGRIHLREVPGP